MSNSQIFNLNKIKELTNPIGDLQVELNQLNKSSLKITKYLQTIENDFLEENFLSQIATIRGMLISVNNKLNKITKINLNKFLDFQDQLIEKYKEDFKDNLKKLNINKEITKKVGLFLIEDRKISKIIDFVSFLPSIEISEWIELLDSLKHNTLFLKSINRVQFYYQNLLQEKLKNELSRIPEEIDPNLIKEYERLFKENPTLTFSEFMRTIENHLSQQELIAKREIIRKVREKEELEKLKKKQEEQKKTYEEYLKLSDREFKRLRRKKSREKLTDISEKSTENGSIEISDEISKKIKKFKSQFEKTFNEKYMVQEDEEKDPIDLIRERKKRKDKEYKQYKDHFEDL
ncbi:MAG: hypothetical protein ACFE9M_06150 [Promethearchaeota archaeon]